MLYIITLIILIIQILGGIAGIGLAISGKEEFKHKKPIHYYIQGVESFLLALWLLKLMQIIGWI